MKPKRSLRIDFLKGLAILAVVYYHFQSVLPYGYLGVELFLVISGYLTMQSIAKEISAGSFSWWRFIINRVVRLWPMVLGVVTLCFVLGYFVMLPDDFENLSQHVIASNFFGNNILSCITTKNYWDIVNLYKPLMHTWYLGVLMQGYVFIATVVLVLKKLCKKHTQKAIGISLLALTVCSLAIYLLPVGSDAQKFYYLPWRLFEILLGGLIAYIPVKPAGKKTQRWLICGQGIAMVLILACLCISADVVPAALRLLTVTGLTAFLLFSFQRTEEKSSALLKPVASVGKVSLSVYLCHQPIVAFMFYSVTDKVNAVTILAYTAVVALMSVIFYYLGERPLGKLPNNRRFAAFAVSLVLCLALTGAAGVVFLNAGVVRDVPELGISTQNVYRGMHAKYCDRPYGWNKDFSSEGKVKVLVIGDSFGRDWANILSESDIADELEISYMFAATGVQPENSQQRIDAADIVFWSTSSGETKLVDMVACNGKNYVVGYKNFGSSNGLIYSRRNTENYFSMSIQLDETAIKNNEILKQHYGEFFVDMLVPVQNADGTIRVFTDTHHFISQDCRHLTQQGAIYYATHMDLSWILDQKG